MNFRGQDPAVKRGARILPRPDDIRVFKGVAGFRIVRIQFRMLREGQAVKAFQVQREQLVLLQIGIENEDGELPGFRGASKYRADEKALFRPVFLKRRASWQTIIFSK